MAEFFQKKLITPLQGLIAVLVVGLLCWLCFGQSAEEVVTLEEPPSDLATAEESIDLYQVAMLDAMVAEESEIQPLVVIDSTSDMVTWDEDGQRVLLLTWNDTPNYYVEGEEGPLPFGEVWAFTDREIAAWYQAQEEIADWDLRLEQLLGLPADSGYTHVTGLWVYPYDICRPAYETDITVDSMSLVVDQEADALYYDWFCDTIVCSYFESAYPWTRLGYTYDWADNGTEYGLSEFLISEEATVEVAFVMSNVAFVDWLERQ